jgi:hypothetical protein
MKFTKFIISIFISEICNHLQLSLRKVNCEQNMNQQISNDNFSNMYFERVAIICTIGNIATLQPKCMSPLISQAGCDVAKFKINYSNVRGGGKLRSNFPTERE